VLINRSGGASNRDQRPICCSLPIDRRLPGLLSQ
jgi:hypothetical protein